MVSGDQYTDILNHLCSVLDPPLRENDSMSLGTIVGTSLAASVVFVLACGFVVWYFARKRYKRYCVSMVTVVYDSTL